MKQRITKALAYLHRYGWIAALIILIEVTESLFAIGVTALLYGIWTLVGFWCRWPHIGCSFQNANHLQMNPDRINWANIRKSDVFTAAGLFLLIGILCIVFA